MALDRNADGVLDADEVLPNLLAKRSGNELLISWPTNTVGVTLEFTESLASPVWRTETSARSLDTDRLTVTIPIANENRFYRLRGL